MQFRFWLENVENQENRQLYMSLVPKELLVKRDNLSKMVDDAYRRGDHKNAERLDAELDELEEKINDMLEDMDDGDMEEDRGEEEKDLDRDWSVQDDMAKIYARYLSGDLDLDDEDTVEVDPEEAKRNGWEYRQGIDRNGKPVNKFYRYIPVTKQQALAKILRGAIWDSSYFHLHKPKVDVIKAMTDEQIIDAARDAYEWKKNLRGRIGRSM